MIRHLTPDELAALHADRAAQGLPPTITDPVAIARASAIVHADLARAAKAAGQTEPTT